MSKYEKLAKRVLSGKSDQNIIFVEMCNMLEHYGFRKRVQGSHHIFYRDDVDEIINIQPKGAKAKAYQVKQVRNLIKKYKLGGLR